MKIKYIFDTVYSNADTIKVSCGTEDVITLSKVDFNNDWSNILDTEYFVSDFQCSDLQNLKISGAEDHNVVFDDETNEKWKEFTKNKIGSKHFNDSLVLDNLDPELPVKIYNQEDFTSWSDLNKFISTAYNTLQAKNSKFTFDFSNLKVPELSLSTKQFLTPVGYTSSVYYFLGFTSSSSLGDTYKDILSKYKKWFDIPEGTTNINEGFTYSGIEESPKLPDSITSMSQAFYKSKLKKLPNIPKGVTMLPSTFSYTDIEIIDFSGFENITYFQATFAGCSKLKTLGNVNLPKATNTNNMFIDCTALEEVGDISIPESTDARNMFGNCSALTTVGNINCAKSSSPIFTNCSNLKQINDISAMGIDIASLSALETLGNVNITGTSLYGFCRSCTSLHSVGNIIAPEATTLDYAFNSSSPLISIGDIYIPKATSTSSAFTSHIDSIGNITCNAILNIDVDSIKVFNTISPKSYILYRWPKQAVAIPYYYTYCKTNIKGVSTELPTSTGYDVWVDYVNDTGTEFVHNITNPVLNITENKESLNKTEVIQLKNINLLEKNASYEHSFNVRSSAIQTANITKTGSNVTLNSIVITDNEDGTVDIDIPCINIADDSVSSGSISIPVTYVSEIDGHEFHGGTKFTLNFAYTWQLNETVKVNAFIVDDDGSELVEDTDTEIA